MITILQINADFINQLINVIDQFLLINPRLFRLHLIDLDPLCIFPNLLLQVSFFRITQSHFYSSIGQQAKLWKRYGKTIMISHTLSEVKIQHQLAPQTAQTDNTTSFAGKQPIINPKLRSVIEQTIQKSAVKSEIISLHKKVFLSKQSEAYKQKIEKIKATLQEVYPDIPVRSIIIHLYKFVLAKYEVGPRDKNLRALQVPQLYERPQKDRRMQIRRKGKSQINWSYDYLEKHKMPPYFVRNWLAYHPLTSPFFDSIIITLPETQCDEYWRFQERRMMADAFTTVDYGVNVYRNWLNDPKCMSKDRYKSTISTVVKNSIRSIEQFLVQKAHRTIPPLRLMIPRFIPNPLLNVRKYFQPELATAFLRCVRLNYCLQTEPALEQDVLAFYQQYAQIMQQQFSKKPEFSSQDDEKIHVKVSIEQRQVWNEELDRYVIARYLEGCPIAAIKRQLQQNYPADVCARCFDRMKLRYRMFKIFRASIRKMNQLMLDLGVSQDDIIGTEAQIKKLMRSPPGYTLRMKLCNLYLDEKQSNEFVLQFHQDLVNYRHGIYEEIRDERSNQIAWNQRVSHWDYFQSEAGQGYTDDGFDGEGDKEEGYFEEGFNEDVDEKTEYSDYMDLDFQ